MATSPLPINHMPQDIKLGGVGPEGEQYRRLYYSLLGELKEAYPGHLPLLQQHLKKVSHVFGADAAKALGCLGKHGQVAETTGSMQAGL